MPAIDITPIKVGVLGLTNPQSIKNVQDSALAILGSPEAIQFQRLEYYSDFKPLALFKDAVRSAFSDFVEAQEDLRILQLVDNNVYDGFLTEVFDAMAEKAISLIKDGSLYSDTLKAHIISSNPEITEDMLKKVPKVGSTAKAAKTVIDLSSLDIDLDSL